MVLTSNHSNPGVSPGWKYHPGRLGWSGGRSWDFSTYSSLFAWCGWVGILEVCDVFFQHNSWQNQRGFILEVFFWCSKEVGSEYIASNLLTVSMGVGKNYHPPFSPKGGAEECSDLCALLGRRRGEHGNRCHWGSMASDLALKVCCSQTNGLIGKRGIESDGCKVVVIILSSVSLMFPCHPYMWYINGLFFFHMAVHPSTSHFYLPFSFSFLVPRRALTAYSRSCEADRHLGSGKTREVGVFGWWNMVVLRGMVGKNVWIWSILSYLRKDWNSWSGGTVVASQKSGVFGSEICATKTIGSGHFFKDTVWKPWLPKYTE